MRVSRLNVANRPTPSRGRGQPTAGDVKTKRGPRSRKVPDQSPGLVLCFSLSAVSSELIQGKCGVDEWRRTRLQGFCD